MACGQRSKPYPANHRRNTTLCRRLETVDSGREQSTSGIAGRRSKQGLWSCAAAGARSLSLADEEPNHSESSALTEAHLEISCRTITAPEGDMARGSPSAVIRTEKVLYGVIPLNSALRSWSTRRTPWFWAA